MVRAHLGLGGNLGDPGATMAAALRAIDARDDCAVVAVSRLFRTPPWGNTDQPDFINACAALDTTLSPRRLLDLALATERDFNRVRAERWGPRTLDIDVLDYAGETWNDADLTLPHPRIGERAFVLVPLADIAPGLVVGGARVADLAGAVDAGGIVAVTASGDWWRG
ncbi:2-amino-4-hydroxy-6-hydroxymethyldihydropteridine diphosphokinase [Jiella sonneratiae]|uniref:2-amino-4-hydroxy-6-hydroxymethyldihydropteridine pyrophosphokinase n=1 Tax=Jiella sonneratiae TaxID=2816856 RepID=A0ABS3IXI7_9HYPH|nr:2-amino-4-hydroxy-6-hydroxymethyldihydropteridine diphosphokinase [Jiella sonneratiae]MBO0902115.1 2-amino-4-hydroxy-6-hydroxymethyldihydropteridine diphosphokinase [Jiella sonneratiae]